MSQEIAIYTLTSRLHDEQSVAAVTAEFLNSLGLAHTLQGADFSTYGTHPLDLIYVRTGGTEGIFKKLLPLLQKNSNRPFFLLTSGKSNSLAASMEILSYLHQVGGRGEIIHGNTEFVKQRIASLLKVEKALRQLNGCRLGVIGKPSDWLIASKADSDAIKQRLGVELVDIPMQALMEAINETPLEPASVKSASPAVSQALPGAFQILKGLEKVIKHYNIQGFTLRCFDLLEAIHNTGCLALAALNADVVASCEGDVPAMLSMCIARQLVGVSGFQANPSRIDVSTGEMVLAHCTIPFNMVEDYELDTHFESGIGVGIRGRMQPGPVTIFKVSGDLSRVFIAEGTLVENLSHQDLCRTQQLIRLNDASQCRYFLTNPIGNHHIVLPGHHQALLEDFFIQIDKITPQS
ncbi:MAG: hypothetical protein IKQ77_08870 [Prevotella sp.]|nr:hypothetical protein [Prevotella sp.]